LGISALSSASKFSKNGSRSETARTHYAAPQRKSKKPRDKREIGSAAEMRRVRRI
jgi:hypothetical protein